MVEPYLGEIKYFTYSRLPGGWHVCDGSIHQIANNRALYSVIGTAYGGDGITTYALPDLRGRVATGASSSYPPGANGGQYQVTLTGNEMPTHLHAMQATNQPGNTTGVVNVIYAQVAQPTPQNLYTKWDPNAPLVQLDLGSLAQTGNDAAHDNIQPSLVLVPCIATEGVMPSAPSPQQNT